MPLNQIIALAVKIGVVVGYIMLTVPMLIWLERKILADFQARIGPSRVGPFGTLQGFVDGIKLVFKEAVLPAEVDRLLYMAAPVVVMIPALSVAAVVPFGGPVEINGTVYPLVIADLPIGILFVLALTSLSVYGVVLSGWASNNKYSLLGGLRSSAQMLAYELPMGFALITGLMIASRSDPGGLFSLSLSKIVDAQSGWFWNWVAFDWRFAFLGAFALVAYYIAGVAETNRAPFDLPEAESELIGGYHTEYGGLKWAMFFLGEYAAMLNVSAIAVTVFLGGWHAPYPDTLFLPANSIPFMLQGIFWFGVKVFTIIMLYIHLRASFPRLRYDRLMAFTWKWLLPTTLASVMIAATILTAAFRLRVTDVPAVLRQSEASLLPGMGGPQGPGFPSGGLPPGMGTPGAPPGMNPPPSVPPGSAPGAVPGTTPSTPGGNVPAVPPANGPAVPAGNAPVSGNKPAPGAPAGGR